MILVKKTTPSPLSPSTFLKWNTGLQHDTSCKRIFYPLLFPRIVHNNKLQIWRNLGLLSVNSILHSWLLLLTDGVGRWIKEFCYMVLNSNASISWCLTTIITIRICPMVSFSSLMTRETSQRLQRLLAALLKDMASIPSFSLLPSYYRTFNLSLHYCLFKWVFTFSRDVCSAIASI